MTKKTPGRENVPESATTDRARAKSGERSEARPPALDGALSTRTGRPPARSDRRATEAAAAPAVKSKPKLVRDSFTIPKDEYALLAVLKERSIALGRPAKKGEVLRAGIAALHAMSDKQLRAALDAVPSLKTGRPPAAETARAPLGD